MKIQDIYEKGIQKNWNDFLYMSIVCYFLGVLCIMHPLGQKLLLWIPCMILGNFFLLFFIAFTPGGESDR